MPKGEVIGLGRSGIAAAKLLNKQGWQVTLVDSATAEEVASRSNGDRLQASQQQLVQAGVTVKLDSQVTLEGNNIPDLIVVSPGVPWDIKSLIAAREKAIATIGEIELAWRYLNSIPWIGITGTNGKTTTTALIASIFQAGGSNAPACGNIGNAACELAIQSLDNDTNDFDWIIAELSSYQIESSAELAPQIGILTTLTPDHLNRHKTLENYYQIKASLLHRCSQKIINGDDRFLQKRGLELGRDVIWTSVRGKDSFDDDRSVEVYVQDGWIVAFGELIAPVSLFKMPGEHNLQNLLVAVAAAKLAGIDQGAIVDAITSFPGVEHRLEYVCTHQGIKFINDSKATNYDAAEVGLNSVVAPLVLIAGGQSKAGDDTAWIDSIQTKAAAVLLIGEAAPFFAQRLSDRNYHDYQIVETMENAVSLSIAIAIEKKAQVVLLSPACASFDRYLSFEARGKHFRELCLAMGNIKED
ncbi:UDP-N-acetylmuramoyl-L-alanine--D-glutamate ligase [Waterburya agarophytonicola K14]|uniref:UDP-N-acetylmuramoylalanine--D-glutamate ligase n=1 Tax=Waterburya agarophytonicola KI4 TaxID=2874699 RepID=A0A964BTN1_9CYAN|nr:UDP-N-acetylmuramoyl-L-alanine--D-glutamate ligase [Waterburya agarophytonicola]MCC0179599.1 UDP-N-acetylmuramoyl-L-alanine--D-glutamate ligase [Waterburya agarophytonicola KI4]